jgi:hypothetical protein
VLAANLERLLQTVPDDALVLDIGGWGKPLTRADWVLDLMPYETRGLYGQDGAAPERFTAETWVRRDLCEREPYPFADNQFDFVVCSHTLEDVRDPVWVCQEINRVGRAGYIEVPSRLEEQSFGVQGPWVGWGHHHWLVDIVDERIDFTFKHHIVHGVAANHFPLGFHSSLSDADRVQALWWTDRFEFAERIHVGPGDIDDYLAGFVTAHLRGWQSPEPTPPPPPSLTRRALTRLGRR